MAGQRFFVILLYVIRSLDDKSGGLDVIECCAPHIEFIRSVSSGGVMEDPFMGTDREDLKPLTPPSQQQTPDPRPERETLGREPDDLQEKRETEPETKIVAGDNSPDRPK